MAARESFEAELFTPGEMTPHPIPLKMEINKFVLKCSVGVFECFSLCFLSEKLANPDPPTFLVENSTNFL